MRGFRTNTIVTCWSTGCSVYTININCGGCEKESRRGRGRGFCGLVMGQIHKLKYNFKKRNRNQMCKKGTHLVRGQKGRYLSTTWGSICEQQKGKGKPENSRELWSQKQKLTYPIWQPRNYISDFADGAFCWLHQNVTSNTHWSGVKLSVKKWVWGPTPPTLTHCLSSCKRWISPFKVGVSKCPKWGSSSILWSYSQERVR